LNLHVRPGRIVLRHLEEVGLMVQRPDGAAVGGDVVTGGVGLSSGVCAALANRRRHKRASVEEDAPMHPAVGCVVVPTDRDECVHFYRRIAIDRDGCGGGWVTEV